MLRGNNTNRFESMAASETTFNKQLCIATAPNQRSIAEFLKFSKLGLNMHV
jgi:hypothetical protein